MTARPKVPGRTFLHDRQNPHTKEMLSRPPIIVGGADLRHGPACQDPCPTKEASAADPHRGSAVHQNSTEDVGCFWDNQQDFTYASDNTTTTPPKYIDTCVTVLLRRGRSIAAYAALRVPSPWDLIRHDHGATRPKPLITIEIFRSLRLRW